LIVKPQLGFTFDCPRCFEPVSKTIDVFALRARKNEIQCSCGNAKLNAWIGDNVLHVLFPCALCGKQHEASFLPERALSGNLCTLECPTSGLPTGYVSTPTQIDYLNCVEANEALSAFIMRYFGIEKTSVDNSSPETFSLIECDCGCRNFTAAYHNPYLRITCQNCKKTVEIYSQKTD